VNAPLPEKPSGELKLSEDGLYYWDGSHWVSTLSHDGRHRWNGREWVPVSHTAAAYVAPSRPPRVPTSWTRPLQYAVAGWYVVQALLSIATPFLFAGTFRDAMNNALAQSRQMNPNAPLPPAEIATLMNGIVTVALVIGAVWGVAIAVVAIIGAMKRWTWVYYAILVLGAFSAIGLPFSLFGAIVGTAVGGQAPIPGTVSPLLNWLAVGVSIPEVAIFIWMLVALIRFGPWATRRPEPAAFAG
jgi:hypothetical protein